VCTTAAGACPGMVPVKRPVKLAEVIEVCWVRAKSSPVSVSPPGLEEGCEVVAILPSGLPVLKKKPSAMAGSGIATAAKVSTAIPVRAFKGMNDWSVMIFLRRHWEAVVVNDNEASRRQ